MPIILKKVTCKGGIYREHWKSFRDLGFRKDGASIQNMT
jgi:hypothetical protein